MLTHSAIYVTTAYIVMVFWLKHLRDNILGIFTSSPMDIPDHSSKFIDNTWIGDHLSRIKKDFLDTCPIDFDY